MFHEKRGLTDLFASYLPLGGDIKEFSGILAVSKLRNEEEKYFISCLLHFIDNHRQYFENILYILKAITVLIEVFTYN